MLQVFASWKLKQYYTMSWWIPSKRFWQKTAVGWLGAMRWCHRCRSVLSAYLLLDLLAYDVEIIIYNLYMYKNYRPVLKEEKLQIYFLNNLYQIGWNDLISFDFVYTIVAEKQTKNCRTGCKLRMPLLRYMNRFF